MYKVIKFFTDLQDDLHPYNVGDEFPRKGVTVSQKRIDELLGNKNRQGTSLIATVADDVPQENAPEVAPEVVSEEIADEEKKRQRKSRGKAKRNEE